MGDVRVDGMPVRLSKTDWEIRRGAPCLGEHTREVLGSLLGLGDAELDALLLRRDPIRPAEVVGLLNRLRTRLDRFDDDA